MLRTLALAVRIWVRNLWHDLSRDVRGVGSTFADAVRHDRARFKHWARRLTCYVEESETWRVVLKPTNRVRNTPISGDVLAEIRRLHEEF